MAKVLQSRIVKCPLRDGYGRDMLSNIKAADQIESTSCTVMTLLALKGISTST